MRRKLITALFLVGLVTTTWAVLGTDTQPLRGQGGTSAMTADLGDGKTFMTSLERVVQTSTSETDREAVTPFTPVTPVTPVTSRERTR